MLTLSEYQSYFEDLATRYKRIAHSQLHRRFAIMDIDEIIGGIRTDLSFDHPTLILEHPEGNFKFRHEKIRDTNFGAFMIIQRCDLSDRVKKTEIMDACKDIGAKACARMHHQKAQRFVGDIQVPKFLEFFDLNAVDYMKVGPILNNCYGWRFEFSIAKESSIPYNPANWE